MSYVGVGSDIIGGETAARSQGGEAIFVIRQGGGTKKLLWLDRGGKMDKKSPQNSEVRQKLFFFHVELNFLSPFAAMQGGDSTAYEGVRHGGESGFWTPKGGRSPPSPTPYAHIC